MVTVPVRSPWIASIVACVLAPGLAHAKDAPPPPAPDRTIPTVLSLVPGVFAHGVGHLARGDHTTGKRLLMAEGVGAAAVATGFVGLFATGGSRKFAAPFALLAIGGVGLFATTWFADVYGAAVERPTGSPETIVPTVESSLGYRYVYDPSMAYRNFVVTSLDARVGRLKLRPEGWFGAGTGNERLRLGASWRFAGARPGSEPAADGSTFDIELAGVRHAYPSERFTITSLEATALGRLDFRVVSPSLRGTFGEASAGLAFGRHDYAVPGATPDATDMLLARFAFGVYLGEPRSGRPFGEASLYYDHRHDGYAGGLKMGGLGSGVVGSFGARAVTYFTPEFGLLAEGAVGSAWIGGLSVLVRQPVRARKEAPR